MAATDTPPNLDDDIIDGEIPTDYDEIITEAGRALILESISIGREFCKFMIGFATGAVPIYLGLVNLYLPEKFELMTSDRFYIGLPVLAFMVSAICFVIGYRPKGGSISIETIDEIEAERTKSIKHRSRWSNWGLTVFVLGVLGGAAVMLVVLADVMSTGAPSPSA